MSTLDFDFQKESKQIVVKFPLTKPTGNVRVRKRKSVNEYGYQVLKDDAKDKSCYIEWQIEYDVKDDKNAKFYSKLSFIRTVKNKNTKKKTKKRFYCLSDFIKFFYDLKIILPEDLIKIKNDLSSKSINDFVHSNKSLITVQERGTLNCETTSISGFELKPFSTVFPLYFVKVSDDIDVEIGLYEGGYATSTILPHLYVCIPFTSLSNFDYLNNRPSKTNAEGEFVIDQANINVFLKIFHLIGLLTDNHKSDVINIIDKIISLSKKRG